MLTILIVDDDEFVPVVAAQRLRHSGYAVQIARSGSAALAILQQDDTISAVLLDMIMPEMDGAEALRQISQARPGLPIIVSSGYTSDQALFGVDETLVAGFLKKPYQGQELVDIIGQTLHPAPASETKAHGSAM